MTRAIRLVLSIFTIVLVAACQRGPEPVESASSATGERAVDAWIRGEMAAHRRAGVQAVVLEDGAPVWRGEYGETDVLRHAKVDRDSIFLVSSMSKPVMAIAVMQALEDAAAARGTTVSALLDAEVSTLVSADDAPLVVRHPKWPDQPISLRMILAHASGIQNRYALVPHHVPVEAPAFDDAAVPDLRSVLTGYLTPGGRYYHEGNFLPERPGTRIEYSSVASSVAALVIRGLTGKSFQEHTRDRIFAPLGMTRTAWRLKDLGDVGAPGALALPHTVRDGRLVSVVPATWENVFYPAASLRTTASEYGKLVSALVRIERGDAAPNERLVRKETLAEMLRAQYKDLDGGQGLIFYWMKRADFWVAGHSGANDGFLSEMIFMSPDEPAAGGAKPTHLYGVVVLTNGDWDPPGATTLHSVLTDGLLRRALSHELGE